MQSIVGATLILNWGALKEALQSTLQTHGSLISRAVRKQCPPFFDEIVVDPLHPVLVIRSIWPPPRVPSRSPSRLFSTPSLPAFVRGPWPERSFLPALIYQRRRATLSLRRGPRQDPSCPSATCHARGDRSIRPWQLRWLHWR